MKKASMVKKSMITGMALAMVIGGSTAAFAHGIEKDKVQDKSGKEKSVYQTTQNPAAMRLTGLQQQAESSAETAGSITRAEMIESINRAFQLTEKAEIAFSDLSSSDSAYEPIAIAVKAGYVKGYPDGTIRPNQRTSREDAISMVAVLVNLKLNDLKGLDKYTHAALVSTWSTPVIAAVLNAATMNGGSFGPKAKFTSAQSFTLLEEALAFAKDLGVAIPETPPTGTGTGTGTPPTGTGTDTPPTGTGTGTPPTGDHGPETGTVKTYAAAGVYGPESGTETIKGNVVVSAPGITLRHLVIEGDLTITAAVGEGDAYFKNMTVKGVVYIQGGGVNSVHFEDCELASVKMF